MDYSEIKKYVGRQVVMKDWQRIFPEPGTRGSVSAVIKTTQGELYLSVRLHDTAQSEELFKPDVFYQMFRMIDHTTPGMQPCQGPH